MLGHHGCDRMVVGLQLPMQSVPITTKVMSSNPAQGRVLLDTTLDFYIYHSDDHVYNDWTKTLTNLLSSKGYFRVRLLYIS
jgi:hypothetical protein